MKRLKRKGTTNLYLGRNKLPTWSFDTFMSIARDRGYVSLRTVVYRLSRELNTSPKQLEKLFRTGRWRWEYILFMGDYFHMTPKEFCDTFLHGYFQEDRGGHYKAKFENAMLLLDRQRNVQTRKEVFGGLTEFEETILRD